jgi:hypothetical protein
MGFLAGVPYLLPPCDSFVALLSLVLPPKSRKKLPASKEGVRFRHFGGKERFVR